MNPPSPVNPEQMRRRLRAVFAEEVEHSLPGRVARRLRDPALPFTAGGRPRPHPLWVTVGLSIVIAMVVFTIFSLLER